MENKSKLFNGLFNFVNYTLLILALFITVLPFYYVFIMSISDPDKYTNTVYLIPHGISFDTYIGIFYQNNIVNASFTSIARTVLGTITTVCCCSFLGYLMTKQFKFRKLIYRMLIITMYFNAGLIPWYLTIKSYGMINSFIVYILPVMIPAFYVVLIKTFIEQIPQSLEESAVLDGAGNMRVFISIIFPLSKPILATIAVFAAVSHWNSWMDNYFFVQEKKIQTLQLILYNY